MRRFPLPALCACTTCAVLLVGCQCAVEPHQPAPPPPSGQSLSLEISGPSQIHASSCRGTGPPGRGGVAGNRPAGSNRDAPARRRSRARDRLGLCRGSVPCHAQRQAAQGAPADAVRLPPQSSLDHSPEGLGRQTSADEAGPSNLVSSRPPARECPELGAGWHNEARRDWERARCRWLRSGGSRGKRRALESPVLAVHYHDRHVVGDVDRGSRRGRGGLIDHLRRVCDRDAGVGNAAERIRE